MEGSLEFIVGPKDHADGTPVKPSGELTLRFESNVYHAKKLAQEFGLNLNELLAPEPFDAEQSKRSREIRPQANPQMAEAAATIEAQRRKLDITMPDGTKIVAEQTEIRFNAHAALSKAIKALASLIKARFNGSGRLNIKIGKWFCAHASGESGGESSRRRKR
jgi:hypothetical protein